jgi:pimeloyl-ACP methyl ester carboxylesterase
MLHHVESGAGPPVLLLHGLFDSLHTWQGVIPRLAPHCKTYAVDLPGFGETPLPTDWTDSLSGMMEAVIAFLDARKLPRISLVGNSMGGSLALGIAGRYPDRVEKMVLLNPYGLAEIPTVVGVAHPMFSYLLNQTMLEYCARTIYARSLYQTHLLTDALIEQVIQPFRALQRRKDLVRFLAGISQREMAEIDARLPHIQQPILTIWGEEDRWLSEAHWMRLKHRMPQMQLLKLPQCGHLPQIDRPQETAEAILSHLAD